jgi:hypothetical protein
MAVAQRAGPSAVKKATASVDGRRLLSCQDVLAGMHAASQAEDTTD